MNLTVIKPELTPELAKTNAIVRLEEAVEEMGNGNLSDAYILYGAAIAFESVYDFLVDNSRTATLEEPEINHLYKDVPEYRNLFLHWVELTSSLTEDMKHPKH